MAIVGGVLIGWGVGMLVGQTTAVLLIGLGAGFVLEGIIDALGDGVGLPMVRVRRRRGSE